MLGGHLAFLKIINSTVFFLILLSTSMLLTYKNGIEFFSFFGHTTLHAELPPPGVKPAPPAVEWLSLNHWITREV